MRNLIGREAGLRPLSSLEIPIFFNLDPTIPCELHYLYHAGFFKRTHSIRK